MLRATVTLLFIVTASAALASDGVIEINAAQAVAGGVTPGDAAGYPVQLTRPGSYRLTGNLDVSALAGAQNLTAISIESSDVDLDLGGFALIGPSVCGGFPFACAPSGTGSGIRSLAEDRTRVHHGAIRGFGRVGILLQADSKVVDVTVSNCAQGGISSGTGSLISDNAVSVNGGPGIQLATGVVRDNSVRGSVFFGIYVSSNATVVNNTVSQTQSSGGNPGIGISVGDTSTVAGNTLTSNQGLGLSLSPFSGFHGNVISGNNGIGNTPQTSGGIQIGPNLCGTDTTCP
jgi:hypothetical protein